MRTIIEKESLELTSDPCSQEVIPEKKGIISFLPCQTVYFDLSWVILVRKEFVHWTDEVKMIIENVIVDLTSDPCSQVVFEKGIKFYFLHHLFW